MTDDAKALAIRIAKNIGILSEDEDVLGQIYSRAQMAVGFINNGGADVDIMHLTEYEFGCVSLAVQDLLNSQFTGYNQGVIDMAHQIQLTQKEGGSRETGS